MGMLGTSTAAHNNLDMIFGRRRDGKHYFRLQPHISITESDMDNPEVVESLHSKASEYLLTSEFQEMINNLSINQLAPISTRECVNVLDLEGVLVDDVDTFSALEEPQRNESTE